jgi:ATP-dependent RNA helicase DDX54/DBP10
LNIQNFADSKFFIPTARDPTKKSEFDELCKITVDDINPFVISDETDALRKRKQTVWDKEKKKYVNPKTSTLDLEDRGMNIEKGK